MSKYGAISGPYFPVFSPSTGKYGPEITSYLDTFQAVQKIVYCVSGSKKPHFRILKVANLTERTENRLY